MAHLPPKPLFCFKSCPRVGGIPIGHSARGSQARFKSCPRVGGISRNLTPISLRKVSSRAPVWGASKGTGWRRFSLLFQVVPPCGGHLLRATVFLAMICFKSCPHVGGIGHRRSCHAEARVSSRAPVWGASRLINRSRRGRRFQVVPPCGGHPSAPRAAGTTRTFQVVPPCGGHRSSLCWRAAQSPFQVVPPCGGHRKRNGIKKLVWSFQVVPPCGGHLRRPLPSGTPRQFQVVPPCGGHRGLRGARRFPLQFQVVPPCGGHPDVVERVVEGYKVSSRAPVWGASGVMTGSRLEMMLFQVVPPCGGHHAGKGAGSRQRQGFKSCPRVGGIGCVRDPVGVEAGFKSCPRVGGIFVPATRYLP